MFARAHPYLLLVLLSTPQEHIHQDVGEEVDGHLIIMLYDESAAVKDFASQLMPHLKHKTCHDMTCLNGPFPETLFKRALTHSPSICAKPKQKQ